MKKYYFTFGTDPLFPYGINEYVVAEAVNKNMAMRMFKAKYPGPHAELANCAFCYSEEEFEKNHRDQYYKGVEPADVLQVKTSEDFAALEIIDRLELYAENLMEICKGEDSTEKDEALIMQAAADEIKRLRREAADR